MRPLLLKSINLFILLDNNIMKICNGITDWSNLFYDELIKMSNEEKEKLFNIYEENINIEEYGYNNLYKLILRKIV